MSHLNIYICINLPYFNAVEYIGVRYARYIVRKEARNAYRKSVGNHIQTCIWSTKMEMRYNLRWIIERILRLRQRKELIQEIF